MQITEAILENATLTHSASAPEPNGEASPEVVTPEPDAEAFDATMIALDNACLRVVAVATQVMTAHPRAKNKVRSRLNILRDELDKLRKSSLPKKEVKHAA
jgi:hypothetical protein